jgi:Coenzyme A transferase
VSVLGALEVSQTGDLANWCIPKKLMKGIGGAMDLVAGVKRIVIATTHVAKNGKPKILKQCTLPLTGARVVDTIITDLAVFQVKKDGSGLVLTEHAPHSTVEEIRAKTEADFEVSPDLKVIQYSPRKLQVPSQQVNEPERPEQHMRSQLLTDEQLTDLTALCDSIRCKRDFASACRDFQARATRLTHSSPPGLPKCTLKR